MRTPATYACALLLVTAGLCGPIRAGDQLEKTFKGEIVIKVKISYLLSLPDGYAKSDKSWPMIVFLHGAGERGNDLKRLKRHGPPMLVEKNKKFPFIVLSPQCPSRKWWNPAALAKLVESVASDYRVDKDRIYLTGLSMGGFGTWMLAAERPNLFAAIAPICGGGEPISARKIKHLPIWVFHGAKDSVIPVKRSQEMVDALKKQGSGVKFTIYPDANHDSWTETYNNPKLYEWFLKHKRVPPKKPITRLRK